MTDRICEHCGAVNDTPGVYCRECGERLPELGEDETPGATAPGIVGRAPGGPTASSRLPVRRKQKWRLPSVNLSFSAMGLLLVALFCLIQASRDPDDLPPAVAIDNQAGRAAFDRLQKCATAPGVMTWAPKLSEINGFLASDFQPPPGTLRRKPAERIFVSLGTDDFIFFVEKSFLGMQFDFAMRVVPDDSGGMLDARPTSVSVGRLPVPAFLAWLIHPQFRSALKKLAPVIELLRKAKTIVITPNDVTLQWLGSGNASP